MSAPVVAAAERAPDANVPDATAALELATEAELRDVLAQRETELGHLLQEVERLERTPQHVEARLRRLEAYFSDLRRGDAVRICSPALHEVGKVMKDEQAMRIVDDVAHGRVGHQSHFLGDAAADGHTDASNLVLGQGFMPLDRMALHYATQDMQRKRGYHPAIEEVHFAGHLPREVAPAQPVFMGPRGSRDAVMASLKLTGSDTFWLDRLPLKAGAPQEPALSQLQPQASAALPGLGQDNMPVDWLGLKQRGIPIPEDLGAGQPAEGSSSWFW